MQYPKLIIHPDVEAALNIGKPVVALESTLITHGFPYPQNLNIAQDIENTVRQNGAVPATIAILNGKITVGLTDKQLNYLATINTARKCSVRDLPLVVATQSDGATTVAATMAIAHKAGISVFATGGIGGVHRGDSLDISADLTELGRTPITVVCAGIKAFLDLPATLEYLETQAVTVVGYQVNEFPAFYSRKSNLPVDIQVNTPQEVVAIINARNMLALKNAILLTVPVPLADEWPAKHAQVAIEQALIEAKEQNIVGKKITPFMLSRIAQLSKGKSMQANTTLLTNNAKVAAQVALALCQPQLVYSTLQPSVNGAVMELN